MDDDKRRVASPGSGAAMDSRPWRRGRFWWILLAALVFNWVLSGLLLARPSSVRVPYSLFSQQVTADNIATVVSEGDAIEGTFTNPVVYPTGSGTEVTRFNTERPTFAQDDLLTQLEAQGTEVNATPITGPGLLTQLLVGFGPTILLVGAFVWLTRRGASMLGSMGGFGRSRASRADLETVTTRFADVAGIDEAKEELVEVVDYLRQPDRYRRIGAMMPHGVLLTGPPGAGKTLLARAVAGEAGVPFFSVSASEFVEMIVGVGASRARDLFKQARAVAPAIIFIDELDAIGRSRASVVSVGGHDEQEQTLNQLLTELDGFTGAEGVVVLAATNRPEILDPALLRPGRFDRRVTVNAPDAAGRAAILAVHTRGVPLDADVDLDAVASMTPGMVGADLRNLVNEAALLAARRERAGVAQVDLTDALDRIVLGSERRIVLDADERQRVAYHEAGHALCGMLVPGADPVRKISIIPRGQALGVTYQSPDRDRYGYTESYLKGKLVGMLGGRAAEKVVFDEISSGAESDLDAASSLARSMVGRWGMNAEIGPVSALPAHPSVGYDPAAFGPDTLELVDTEVRSLIGACYREAIDLLAGHRAQLERLATALLANETLDEAEARAVVEREPTAA